MRSLRTMTLPSTIPLYGTVLLLGALLLATSVGCGGTDQQPEMPNPAVVQGSADDLGLPVAEADPLEMDADETSSPSTPVRVVAGERSALEGTSPAVSILRPRAGETIRNGNVMLRLQVQRWELGPDPGRHVHVIVDNEPYIAVRNVSGPIDLNALVRENLGHELSEGTHVLRVFPSRDHHESVKTDGAFAMVVFHYRSASDHFEFDADAPLLTYSRPKGCNVAGERILLDFYLTHAELSEEGFRVRYDIDGAITGEITTWAPHWIENLPAMPQHTVQLQLIDAEGQPVPGPFNDTIRTISVQDSCD